MWSIPNKKFSCTTCILWLFQMPQGIASLQTANFLFLEFSLMKLAISYILVVYYVETMIFLGKLSNPCGTKCCKMESSWEMYFYVTRIIDIAMTLTREQGIWMIIKSWPNYISSETNLLESASLMMRRHFRSIRKLT